MQLFKTKKQRDKTAFSLIAVILLLLPLAIPLTVGDQAIAKGTHMPTYSYLNVFPNPAGVGQQITLNIFLSTVFPSNEVAKNFTVEITNPDGQKATLGPYTSDLTCGTVAYFAPDKVGNYTIVFKYLGQMLTNSTTYNTIYADPSQSAPTILVVQQDPVIEHALPFTPLPTEYWQTPVSAENSQNWYVLTGAWLGLKANDFASTGSYDLSGYYNPYTESVMAAHVMWTKPWLAGGVAGGDNGGGEIESHYWSTFQYTPRYAPVCINGILYSTQFSFGMSSGANNGIVAMNLYTGEELFRINTTNTLRCGSQFYMYTINDYGVRGPWLWTTGTLPAADTGGNFIAGSGQSSSYMNTTGTQWNLYDGITGQYVMSVVNGSSLTLSQDDNGNLIGYFVNNTAGTQYVHPVAGQNVLATTTGPHVTAVNLTVCMGVTGAMSPTNIARNTVRAMQAGYMFDVDVPGNLTGGSGGVRFDPALSLSSVTGGCLVFTSGSYMYGTQGYVSMASLDAYTGQFLAAANITSADTKAFLPYTRAMSGYGEGLMVWGNCVNMDVVAYNVKTCTKAWDVQLKGDNGAEPNIYDLFQVKPYFGRNLSVWVTLGGDIWAINTTTGKQAWYTNTTKMSGSSGLETPYNIWPLWVFSSSCTSNEVGYFSGGHEYNPPLFHGAQLYAVNMTDGSMVWKTLDTSVTSTIIAYGRVVSLNAYDNQLYCFGKGPSKLTVEAPSVGVSTATPITITGSITDTSPGTESTLVKSKYPAGLPCVSDESESLFMESVYQQQAMPYNITGVPITLSVVDSNGNFRDIGSTTSDITGHYGLTWTPDISGNYTIIASFEGSNSYYPATSSTYFYASESATPQPTQQPLVTGLATTSDLVMYLAIVAIAIIIAIAVVGLLIIKKRP
jgi:hypothetical protein